MRTRIQSIHVKEMGRKVVYTVLFIYCFLSGCTVEDHYSHKINGEESANVIFSLEIPGKNNPITKGMSGKEENAVNDIDVLVFNTAENEDEKRFLYAAYARGITTDDDNQSQKTFTVTLATGTYDIIILANVRDCYTLSDLKGLTKQEVQQLIKISNATPWNATSENNFRAIPMWGEKQNVKIEETTRLTGDNSIKLLRMLAKVNVINSAPESDFILQSVYIYNPNTLGFVIPHTDNITETIKENSTYIKATKPSLPAEITPSAIPWIYTGDSIVDENNDCKEEIYIFEAQQGTTDLTRNTCIIIGGTYKGTTSWYRADFANTANNVTEYLPVLRNHVYTLNITSIGGPGKNSPDEAFKSAPVNIQADIIAWNEGEMNDITWNELNQLTVNSSRFTFHAKGSPQLLDIFTDYIHGWQITDYPDWISPDKTTGPGDVTTSVSISAEEWNSQIVREGIILIEAGTLTKKIYVTQNNEVDLSLIIDPNSTITFYKKGGTKSVYINVQPQGASLTFTPESGSKIIWDPSTLPVSGEGSGTYEFTALSRSDNDNSIYNSTIVVTATDAGNTRQATINFQQLPTNLLFEFTPWEKYKDENNIYYYPPEGSTLGEKLYFYARTVRHWKYESSTPTGIFEPQFEGYQVPVNEQQKEYYFNLEPNTKWYPLDIDITVSSADSDINSYAFALTQYYKLPHIEITKPTGIDKEIDFSDDNSGTKTEQLLFTTNAAWRFIKSGAYDILGLSSEPEEGVEAGDSSNSQAENKESISFTASKLEGKNGIPAAESVVTATITIESRNHTPAPDFRTEQIKLKRTIPAFFDNVKFLPPATDNQGRIARATPTIQATAETNDDRFSLNGSNGESVTLENKTAWGEKKLSLIMKSNDTWEEREVKVKAIYNATTVKEQTYTQAGKEITIKEISTVPLSLTDGFDIKTRIGGSFDSEDIEIRITDTNTGTILHNKYVPAAQNTTHTLTFNIGANTTSNTRHISVEIKTSKDNTWQNWESYQQEPQAGYRIYIIDEPTMLPAKNASFTLKIETYGGGSYPYHSFSISSDNDTPLPALIAEFRASSESKEFLFDINDNPLPEIRTIIITKYLEDGTGMGTIGSIFTTLKQAASEPFNFKANLKENSIPYSEASVTVEVQGHHPDILIQAVLEDGTVIGTTQIPNGTFTTTLGIQDNPITAERTIFFRNTDVDGNWENLGSVIQQAAPFSARFATSNIIKRADGSLWFATNREENAIVPANAQGLIFKFGSLVGVDISGYEEREFSSEDVVFWPEEYTSPTIWTQNNIPYFDDNNFTSEDIFMDTYWNTEIRGCSVSEAKGDICRYISEKGWVAGKWRMPTETEINRLINNSSHMSTAGSWEYGSITVTNNPANTKGTGVIPSGWLIGNTPTNSITAPPTGTVFLPASGSMSTGVSFLNSTGFYWTASTRNTSGSNRMYVEIGQDRYYIEPIESEHFFSVRCIRAGE